MNFVKGIVEVTKQTYRHLKKLLKPLPLATPTSIELSPDNKIQVTLLEANHCLGAVMFLIESSSDAILYTGDIRSEPWWVNSLTRSPSIVQYVHSGDHPAVRRLSKIYLDTTFAVKAKPYRAFPSKAEGLAEILRAVKAYPPTTQFYMHAWTFGYEDVWLALSQALNSQIHLDRYRFETYTSVRRSQGPGFEVKEAPALCGFMVGNVQHRGILTRDPTVRLHSCEKGSGCPMLVRPQKAHVVHIKPIISRHGNQDITEMGLGGGKGDLDQIHELYLGDASTLHQLTAMCTSKIKDKTLRDEVIQMLERRVSADDKRIDLDQQEPADMSMDEMLEVITRLAQRDGGKPSTEKLKSLEAPDVITFPYSRHSSYEELRHLLSVFRPKDVFPCTAPTAEEYDEGRSMQALFGDVCYVETEDVSEDHFSWDVTMRFAVKELNASRKRSFAQMGVICNEDGAETQYQNAIDDLTSSQDQYQSANDGRNCLNTPEQVPVSHLESSSLFSSSSDRLAARERARIAAIDGVWGEHVKLRTTRSGWMDEEF